jgi:hypothetical protein
MTSSQIERRSVTHFLTLKELNPQQIHSEFISIYRRCTGFIHIAEVIASFSAKEDRALQFHALDGFCHMTSLELLRLCSRKSHLFHAYGPVSTSGFARKSVCACWMTDWNRRMESLMGAVQSWSQSTNEKTCCFREDFRCPSRWCRTHYRPVRKYMPQPHPLSYGVRLSSYHISRVCTIWKVK